jgi:hypothetical protein
LALADVSNLSRHTAAANKFKAKKAKELVSRVAVDVGLKGKYTRRATDAYVEMYNMRELHPALHQSDGDDGHTRDGSQAELWAMMTADAAVAAYAPQDDGGALAAGVDHDQEVVADVAPPTTSSSRRRPRGDAAPPAKAPPAKAPPAKKRKLNPQNLAKPIKPAAGKRGTRPGMAWLLVVLLRLLLLVLPMLLVLLLLLPLLSLLSVCCYYSACVAATAGAAPKVSVPLAIHLCRCMLPMPFFYQRSA